MTYMKSEIAEIPGLVAQLLDDRSGQIANAAQHLAQFDPHLVATIARGSSDHAAGLLKYGCELNLGLPVASIGPSIASIYGVDLKLERAGAIAISQSGKSPDIVAMLESARRSGAASIAITNDAASPLAQAAHSVIDIGAGVERSVAATKTFVTSVVAGLGLVALLGSDEKLKTALKALPEALQKALSCDWSDLVAALDGQTSLYVLGRGPGAAVAAEAALKFKETSGLHAEAYSTAEVLHGPSAIVGRGFPVLALAIDDLARDSVIATCQKLVGQGGTVFVTDPAPGNARALPAARTGHGLTDPVALVVSFYTFIEALARHRGYDPDRPPHLNKVTATR